MRYRGGDLLCDSVDLWGFTRVQECVRGTTVCSANVKRENKLSRGAVIRCAGHREAVGVIEGECKREGRFDIFRATLSYQGEAVTRAGWQAACGRPQLYGLSTSFLGQKMTWWSGCEIGLCLA